MIVKMLKAHVVARRRDRDALLGALRSLGAVHLVPVDPARAVADAETTAALDRFRRARQVLENTAPSGEAPDLSAEEAAAEVLRLQREAAELKNRLAALHRQIGHLAMWGDLRIQAFEALRAAGVEPRFFAVPTSQMADVRAEFVHALGPWPGKRSLVAIIHRDGEPEVPETAEAIPLPQTDRPTLRAEAAKVDAALKAGAERLTSLAQLAPAMATAQAKLEEQAEWTVATQSALADEHLYALQGWVPQSRAATLANDLRMAGVAAAVEVRGAAPDEDPPTLIQYPRWARPMKGLFQILGTVPGYAEFDVSWAFMVFLPIFSAILISDAGYGLLYLALGLALYRKMAKAAGPEIAQLLVVIGSLSVIWGVLTSSFFGFDFSGLMRTVPGVGPWYQDGPPVMVNIEKDLSFLMWLSILLGSIQLSLAHVWRAVANFPHLRFLSNLGWAAFLWGMYGVLTSLLLEYPWRPVFTWLLLVGAGLAILFAAPSRNPLKMLGLGIANFPLSAIGTFGDTVSYVRLMAIGLGGASLAATFNSLASDMPWVGGVLVLIAGHALNLALSAVAILAHGVRLNMLEFSNNLGMQWSGYPYEPFSKKLGQEN